MQIDLIKNLKYLATISKIQSEPTTQLTKISFDRKSNKVMQNAIKQLFKVTAALHRWTIVMTSLWKGEYILALKT